MKFIAKPGAPVSYRNWRKKVRGTQDADYRRLRNPVKKELHGALVLEQGFLCAYTMKRIDVTESHIEHIKPETLCRKDAPESDLEYENLVACFPRDGMDGQYRYGAQARDDWWDNGGSDFIKPIQKICESSFHFDLEGRISPVKGSKAAAITIKKLNLWHDSLTEDRKRVIREFIYGPNGDRPLSVESTKRASRDICKRKTDKSFNEFCVAIRSALGQYLQRSKANAQRQKYARKRKQA